jgi:hypothetical protein
MRIGLAGGAIAVVTGPRLSRADDGFETNDTGGSIVTGFSSRETSFSIEPVISAPTLQALPPFLACGASEADSDFMRFGARRNSRRGCRKNRAAEHLAGRMRQQPLRRACEMPQCSASGAQLDAVERGGDPRSDVNASGEGGGSCFADEPRPSRS